MRRKTPAKVLPITNGEFTELFKLRLLEARVAHLKKQKQGRSSGLR